MICSGTRFKFSCLSLLLVTFLLDEVESIGKNRKALAEIFYSIILNFKNLKQSQGKIPALKQSIHILLVEYKFQTEKKKLMIGTIDEYMFKP
jgi:hypothetical protein